VEWAGSWRAKEERAYGAAEESEAVNEGSVKKGEERSSECPGATSSCASRAVDVAEEKVEEGGWDE
jgi:hypothetical protein